MAKTTLYLKDQRKTLRYWSIESHEKGIATAHGIVNGAYTDEFEEIYSNTVRSRAQQIQSVMASKIKRRIEKGYVRSIDAAVKRGGCGLNELDLPRPMLAAKFDPNKIDPTNYYKQPKLDGLRCVISKNGNDVQAYSRNGKPIDSIYEIIEQVRNLPVESIIIDGELYHHGTPLQTLNSMVKRRQEETKSLTYWAYDIVSNDPFSKRIKELNAYADYCDENFVKTTPTVFGVKNITEELALIKSMGYEGLILRHPEASYESGKRSKHLLKVKSRFDEEFLVVDIVENKIGGAILCCQAGDKIFGTPAPGTQLMKEQIYKMRDKFIGQYIRVEYANLTKDGLPFHPVATMWRNKHDE